MHSVSKYIYTNLPTYNSSPIDYVVYCLLFVVYNELFGMIILRYVDEIYKRTANFTIILLIILSNSFLLEMGHGACDYGRSKSVLSRDFPHHDFSLVELEEWWTVLETQEHVSLRFDIWDWHVCFM